ncbi:uncharacterized protein BYT42DRAFT_589230 [Radiomyces spectabilis]|uniref:uncharacterized protein n=1 Tax=Radiomyces spectabilis TaxID=64574 RepID=UPI00221E9993|nr:uncharacterized protein BYT42DRAFT_589230 [Radiomyces spectabilis]KAI8365224.1 hypothetical protein BYT42DRAFT_589230 [Radiomyces spectabilis]
MNGEQSLSLYSVVPHLDSPEDPLVDCISCTPLHNHVKHNNDNEHLPRKYPIEEYFSSAVAPTHNDEYWWWMISSNLNKVSIHNNRRMLPPTADAVAFEAQTHVPPFRKVEHGAATAGFYGDDIVMTPTELPSDTSSPCLSSLHQPPMTAQLTWQQSSTSLSTSKRAFSADHGSSFSSLSTIASSSPSTSTTNTSVIYPFSSSSTASLSSISTSLSASTSSLPQRKRSLAHIITPMDVTSEADPVSCGSSLLSPTTAIVPSFSEPIPTASAIQDMDTWSRSLSSSLLQPPKRTKSCSPCREDQTEKADAVPRRQKLRYEGDNYTPKWVRYTGHRKEGYCDSCEPGGKWLQLKNSAYWYHKQFFHGISSVSGKPFLDPIDQRVGPQQDTIEGLCHQCRQYVLICNGRRKNNNVLWYRHAHKVNKEK